MAPPSTPKQTPSNPPKQNRTERDSDTGMSADGDQTKRSRDEEGRYARGDNAYRTSRSDHASSYDSEEENHRTKASPTRGSNRVRDEEGRLNSDADDFRARE